MQDLKITGVENGALVAVSDDGERFRIAVDESLHARIRQAKEEIGAVPHKVSPRDVQAQIRAGLSAPEVSALTGASLDYVQRFEGPIVAEREHITALALSVPVRSSFDVDPLGEESTFGAAIAEKLTALKSSARRWASWKDPDAGWLVKLEFTVDDIDHDARWSFDVRKSQLTPLNPEATTLSQSGDVPANPLIPRLRAVLPHESAVDTSRFDSDAFTFAAEQSFEPDDENLRDASTVIDSVQQIQPVEAHAHVNSAGNNSIAVSAINRAEPEKPRELHHTADLLEALRRRRGERDSEPAPTENAEQRQAPVDTMSTDTASLRFAEETITTAHDFSGNASPKTAKMASSKQNGRGKGRSTMPSWDEIVFGARTDDDPA